eukprot:923007-Rhodomonas_salina.1
MNGASLLVFTPRPELGPPPATASSSWDMQLKKSSAAVQQLALYQGSSCWSTDGSSASVSA